MCLWGLCCVPGEQSSLCFLAASHTALLLPPLPRDVPPHLGPALRSLGHSNQQAGKAAMNAKK